MNGSVFCNCSHAFGFCVIVFVICANLLCSLVLRVCVVLLFVGVCCGRVSAIVSFGDISLVWEKWLSGFQI